VDSLNRHLDYLKKESEKIKKDMKDKEKKKAKKAKEWKEELDSSLNKVREKEDEIKKILAVVAKFR